MRTIVFIRGLRAAIREKREALVNRPVRVLYAGCGPFGTLAVPLVAVLEEEEAQFTLLDIHEESIASVRTLVEELGVAGSISEFVVSDAMKYEVNRSEKPDVIVMETMQAILDKEMQLPMTRWLLSQAPEATLVPREVKIDLVIVDPEREFDLNGEGLEVKRQMVGEVFSLSKESAEEWKVLEEGVLPGDGVVVPEFAEGEQGMLFTTVQVYGDHILQDRQSSLTCPRYWPESLVEGERWQFAYQVEGVPKLIWERVLD